MQNTVVGIPKEFLEPVSDKEFEQLMKEDNHDLKIETVQFSTSQIEMFKVIEKHSALNE